MIEAQSIAEVFRIVLYVRLARPEYGIHIKVVLVAMYVTFAFNMLFLIVPDFGLILAGVLVIVAELLLLVILLSVRMSRLKKSLAGRPPVEERKNERGTSAKPTVIVRSLEFATTAAVFGSLIFLLEAQSLEYSVLIFLIVLSFSFTILYFSKRNNPRKLMDGCAQQQESSERASSNLIGRL
jgi:hypothetical protein